MKFALLILLLAWSVNISAQSGENRIKHINTDQGLGIEGYDPVAYFISNKAVKGLKKYSVKFQGITYCFSSDKNKTTFLTNPSKYEPQYGGWCAYAMGNSAEKVEIDPETFKIIDGKLYVFYNAYFNNTLNSWNKYEKNLKTKADKNWSTVIKSE